MKETFEQLVETLSVAPVSINVLSKLTLLIKQQTNETFSSFVSRSIPSLLILKTWTWERFSCDARQWIGQPEYVALFYTLAAFHKSFIATDENVESEIKASLLIPTGEDQVNSVFRQINQSDDENDPFIRLVSIWFDNLSFFICENPDQAISPIIRGISHIFSRDYLMTDQFKLYLGQLQQATLPRAIFTAKQLFYVNTCLFSVSSCLVAGTQSFICTPEEMLRHVGKEYLQIMHIHSQLIAAWNRELFSSITHLTNFVLACCWWGGDNSTHRLALLSSEQITCDLAQALIGIVSYEPFHEKLRSKQTNGESRLIYASLKFLLNIVQAQNINWFFRSNIALPDALHKVTEMSASNQTCLCAYAILGEILEDDKLKELTYVYHVGKFFFDILEQGWHHPSKKYKQMPISFLLRSFVALSKSESVQQSVLSSHKLSLFIDMCDDYPIVFDIIWAMSFNQDIQQQLRSNAAFIDKLSHLAQGSDHEKVRKATSGILWNLEIDHRQHRTSSDVADESTFDIMISYSHKDKLLCKQLYDELTRRGYRVWIDFDQMHGNVMDAMAHAIDRSHTIIICMSEQYRKSNFCRAEAHYAFQRQRHIVPVLMQKHYKADGWLLFLIGQLLYVDFTKYDFDRAMEMLMKELQVADNTENSTPSTNCEQKLAVLPAMIITIPPKLVTSPVLPKHVADWTQKHVQEWLAGNNLPQLSHLLVDLNGHSLLYFHDYIKNGDTNQILHLVQEDSLRKTGQSLSLTELSCFQSLMEILVDSSDSKAVKKTARKGPLICCPMM